MKISTLNLFSRTFSLMLIFSATFISLTISQTAQATGVNDLQSQRDAVDKAHNKFAQNFYKKLIQLPTIESARFNTVAALSKAVKHEQSQQNNTKAVALIIRNKYLLTQEYDNPEVITLVKAILDNNALYNAQSIIKAINGQWDDAVNAQLNYLMADFYFQRFQWQKTLSLLENNLGNLSGNAYHNALLIKGISLQKQGHHKAAIAVYSKVPANAESFTEAQFNLALANIRQGWWTDGHQIIKQLLANPVENKKGLSYEKTLNRLYITLGYSLLNQAYYRNARKAFKLVGINSRYSNQALLGIALTAVHQEDYIGALNATRVLKAKDEDALPIDEAYLLMPFFYEKTQQLDTASLGYSEASTYYQDKIIQLNRLINSPSLVELASVNLTQGASIHFSQYQVNLSEHYPTATLKHRDNASQYNHFAKALNNRKLNKELQALNQEYNKLLTDIATQLLTQKVAHINSYLNQSRYGLARLYDNNTVTP